MPHRAASLVPRVGSDPAEGRGTRARYARSASRSPLRAPPARPGRSRPVSDGAELGGVSSWQSTEKKVTAKRFDSDQFTPGL